MPVECSIEDRILQVSITEDFRVSQLREAMDAAIASPDFAPPLCVLADGSRSEANPDVSELREAAAYLGGIREHFLPDWILVVSSTHRYGLARMFSVFTEAQGIRLHVYRDLAAARLAARGFVD